MITISRNRRQGEGRESMSFGGNDELLVAAKAVNAHGGGLVLARTMREVAEQRPGATDGYLLAQRTYISEEAGVIADDVYKDLLAQHKRVSQRGYDIAQVVFGQGDVGLIVGSLAACAEAARVVEAEAEAAGTDPDLVGDYMYPYGIAARNLMGTLITYDPIAVPELVEALVLPLALISELRDPSSLRQQVA